MGSTLSPTLDGSEHGLPLEKTGDSWSDSKGNGAISYISIYVVIKLANDDNPNIKCMLGHVLVNLVSLGS